MKQGAAPTDHSGAIWVLGILLVLAVMATSVYWQNVGLAVLFGGSVTNSASGNSGDWQGLWATVGAFLLVLILAGVAQANKAMGGVALMLLLGLWVLFLISQAQPIARLIAILENKSGLGENPIHHGGEPGGGGGVGHH